MPTFMGIAVLVEIDTVDGFDLLRPRNLSLTLLTEKFG